MDEGIITSGDRHPKPNAGSLPASPEVLPRGIDPIGG